MHKKLTADSAIAAALCNGAHPILAQIVPVAFCDNSCFLLRCVRVRIGSPVCRQPTALERRHEMPSKDRGKETGTGRGHPERSRVAA
jgi:hypothetical protein